MKHYLKSTLLGFGLLVAACDSGHDTPAGSYEKSASGVIVTPSGGAARAIALDVIGDGIIHVVASPTGVFDGPKSLMAPNPPVAGSYEVTASGGKVVLKTGTSCAEVDLATGLVEFFDADGNKVLAEAGQPTFTPTMVQGQPYVKASQQFNKGTDESFYGLGQHQNFQMDWNGEDLELAQHNMDIAIPMVLSTGGYGLLWDNNGVSRFGNPEPYKFVGDGLKVESDGKPGFKAQYFLGDTLAVEQQEAFIDYEFIEDQAKWPEAAKAQTVAATSGQNTAGNAVQTQRVTWTGDVTADETGTYKFQLYGSSYFKVYVGDKLVLDRWRQNWNPWFHNFEVPMTAGKPVAFRVEWEPNAGYIALQYNKPLADADRHSLWMTSDVARAVNYYFIPGKTLDDVVAGYRTLTGKAVMMPKWAYGFWQSRQRYNTQAEVLGVVKKYRELNIPIDNIVQDWFYWREDQWGSHEFDPARFPDPKGMIDQVHDMNARFMISVWPKFYPNTDNYKELAAKGYTYLGNLEAHEKDWVGPGYENTDYDPYAPEARAIYWRQMKEKLAVLGVDAWWMDATEPDIHSNLSLEQRADRMGPTAMGPGAEFFNSFPLVHAEGVYEGLVDMHPDTRPFILTRSGFGGIQRTGSALWSGDIASRWEDLMAQVAAGVNLSMSGIPNWTFDIGGFALEDRYTRQDPAHIEEWRELNLRWFQFGAFVPLFRSHGEFPYREIYEISPEGSPMRASMVWYDQLRYRLMPYIYTIAADTWHHDGTMMRGLVMDFEADKKARNIADEYMFGPAFLVAPVGEFGARSRAVYLPEGADWYDLNTGKFAKGGQTVTAYAPYERMPVFVRAGSIVPMGPVTQYVDEKPDATLTITVYTGANGSFSLYEDDGVSMKYRNGAYSRIPMVYDDASGVLTIGAREGGYDGMPEGRAVVVRWMRDGSGIDAGTAVETPVDYSGTELTAQRPF
ncbi:MAG: DUF5110 domain-containing protein [Alphaproteobacteria bacterium]|nr:MAG: DUF5110 domain-containing protein [Alphaproteobacteria bacterium]